MGNACQQFAAIFAPNEHCFNHPCDPAESCKNSADGTTFECTLKECTCVDIDTGVSIGDAAVGTDCPKHGENKCMSCNSADKEFQCGKCVDKVCQCLGGTPAQGSDCPDYGSGESRMKCT